MGTEGGARGREPPVPPRLDLIAAALLFAVAAGALAAAQAMPTFTDRGGAPFAAPGFVPSLYAGLLAVLAILLAARAAAAGALTRSRRTANDSTEAGREAALRLLLATALAAALVFGLIGRVPFAHAAAGFIAAFILVFEWRREPLLRRLRRCAEAAVIAVAAAAAITFVFERVFLLRLP
ncbi:MAG: tripartite tricarboxylate transporter TctB family protein [Elioraea sp.]|nr:tripartite tricarboxylate transporter TctB family protein [Elioraea sp.]